MTTVRWMLLSLIAIAVFALPQEQASAGGSGACVTDFWGKCVGVARHRHAYRWRYYRNRRHHHHRHHGRWNVPGAGERIDQGLFCHARRRVVGEEAPGKKKAQDAAQNAWMGSVRYDHGERYQDINHAKNVRQTCDFSSGVRPGLGEKFFKRDFFRCVIEATPCRAPPSATEEHVERRYEVESDDK